MANPAYRSRSGTWISGSGDWTVSKPSGVVDGDVLLSVGISIDSAATFTHPSGFTSVQSTSGDASGYVALAYKIASSEGANYTANLSGGSANTGTFWIVAYSGANGTQPGNSAKQTNGSSSTSVDCPSVTPTGSEDLLFCLYCATTANASWTFTAPSGMTARDDGFPANNALAYGFADVGLSGTSATGTKTATLSNASGSKSISLIIRGLAGGDTTAPTVPSGLAVTGSTASSITWGWSASTDDTAVTGYDVQIYDASDVLLTTVNLGTVLTYTLSGLTAGTIRKAKVRAHDAVPNNSAYSTAVSGTALDTSAPTTPSGLAVSAATTTSITWTWSAATDNVAVTGYRIRRRDAANAIIDTVDLGNVLTYTWTGLSATNQRGLEVAAFDAAGNVSAFSSVVTGTASASGDTSPPTVPSGLAVTATTSSTITWSWTASTDVGGGVVAGYRIQRLNSDDSVIDTVDIGAITTYQWTGLSSSTTKKIKVAAFDNAGTPNVSSYSSSVAGTTAVSAAQLYARITLNRPATLSDPGYPPVAVTMPGMVYKGWPGDAGFSVATGVKVTFTVGNLNEIAAPMPLTWGDGTTVASGDAGFAFATNWNGTVTIVNATHGQIGSRFTVGA